MRIIVIATLALLLTGCVPADPVVTPVPAPSSTPLFATDADALKAAEAAYAAYLKVSDEILADGGADPERIDAVVDPRVAKVEKAGYNKFAENKYRQVGSVKFDTVSLENYDQWATDGTVVVTIYLCADVSTVDVVDAAGVSVVSPSRPNRTPFEVGFDLRGATQQLIVSSKNVWEGKSFC